MTGGELALIPLIGIAFRVVVVCSVNSAVTRGAMVMFPGEAEVRRLLDWGPPICAMETALTAFSAGRVIQPVRDMLTIEEGKRYLGIMLAVCWPSPRTRWD
jgi:hypothetical protein